MEYVVWLGIHGRIDSEDSVADCQNVPLTISKRLSNLHEYEHAWTCLSFSRQDTISLQTGQKLELNDRSGGSHANLISNGQNINQICSLPESPVDGEATSDWNPSTAITDRQALAEEHENHFGAQDSSSDLLITLSRYAY